jgi:hypothetical protein
MVFEHQPIPCRMKSLIVFLMLFCAAAAGAETTHRLTGFVRDTGGTPIVNLTIHFYQKNGKTFKHLTAVTGANGLWTVELPPGEWRGAAHTDDILSRGYFCEPGFIWCDTGDCIGGGGSDWPPLWGGGEIIWDPIAVNPGLVILTIVPTRPELSVEKARTAEAGVKVSFETTTQTMSVVRQWRIEKSADLLTWTPMQTVALSGTSPVIVPDPSSATTPVCYYRAVQVEDLVPSKP